MLAFVHELIYCTYLLWLASLVQIVRPPILSHFSDRPHPTTRFSTIKKNIINDNILFSTTLHNHISEGNLKWRNLCGKLRRALALSLILQIYSLTKLDNKIGFFLGIFVKVQKSLSLRPETEVQKVKISNKDQNWQSLKLSSVHSQLLPSSKTSF